MAEKRFIRVKDAVAKYNLSRSTFSRAVQNGDLIRHKVGNCAFLDEEQICSWITGETDSR